jgi:chaperonin cofactor prefoldin
MGGQVCTVCGHPDRLAIETALMGGMSGRRIAAQWDLAETSLRRHKTHIQAILQPAQTRLNAARRATLEERLEQAHAVLDEAEKAARNAVVVNDDGEAIVGVDGDLLVKSVSARAKLVALEFGTKREVTRVDPKTEFDALSPEEKRERLAEAKTRVAELEAEVAGGEH